MKKRKRQHKCKSVNEYKSILQIYNWESAQYFGLHGLMYKPLF